MRTKFTGIKAIVLFVLCCSFAFTMCATQTRGACGTVTGLSTTNISATSAKFNWASISCDSFIVKYYVTGTTSYLYKYVTPGTATNVTITGLTGSRNYSWQIHTYCSGTSGPYSSVSSFSTLPGGCGIPAVLTATNVTTNSATLNWALTSCDSFLLKYYITGTTSYIYKYIKPGTTISTPVTGLNSSTNYTWMIHTYCNGVSGPYVSSTFNTYTTSCSTPTGLNATNITTNSATLNWTTVIGAVSYSIRYRVVGASSWTTVTSTTNSVNVSSLTSSTNYQFGVKTVCFSNSSSYSSSVSFTTLAASCSTPTGLTATSITSSSATLNWTAVSGAVSYNIRYRIVGASSWTTTTSVTNTKSVSSLTSSSNYEFQVQTVCSASSSSYSSSSTFTTSAAPCGTPTGLSTASITSSSAILNWTVVSGAVSYNIRYRIVGASSWTTTTSATNTKSVSSLTSSSNYEFQVQTVCSASSSSYSSSTNFTTLAPTCSNPTGLTASSVTNTSATLSWTAVTGVVSYNIRYRIVGASSWTTTTSTTNSKSVSSLTAGSAYEFQVQTVCSASSSSYSSSSNFNTTSSASLPVPDHIVIVMNENYAYSQIIGNSDAPYINSLATGAMGANFTQSFGVVHPSQPNYIDLFSGSNQGITNNVITSTQLTSPNLAKELQNVGRTFKSYSENLPSVGFLGEASGYYVRRHNAVTNWIGTGTNQLATSVAQPFSAFPTDYTTLPTVSWVVPELRNDMHDGTIAQGDTWLQNNLGGYITWAKTHNSLFIFTFDEDDGAHNNQIPTIFVGQMIQAGQYSTNITHYTVLRTIEDMYGLAHLGNTASETPIHGCWTNGFRFSDATSNELEWEAHPNPFSSELNISYLLPHASSVSVEMFNLLGEKIYSEENIGANQTEGIHQLKIDAAENRIQKGIYFIRLTINGAASSRKVVMID